MKTLSAYRQNDKRLLDDASTGSQMPPRVSIGDNQFTLIDPSGARTAVPFHKDGPVLDVIIVDRNTNMSKLLWNLEGTYNKSEVAPPMCFSDNGVAPSANAMNPQSPTCGQCPHNVIGSAISQISGAKIKRCGDLKKLAVVVKDYDGVYVFTVSPGSFKAWNNYTNMLRMQKLPEGGLPDLSDVVTRIRFVGQGILSFEAIELVTDNHPMAPQVINVWERNKQNDITGMMVGRFDQPAQGVLPAPQAGQAGVQYTQQTPPPPPQNIFGQTTTVADAVQENKKPRGRAAAKKDEPAQIQPQQPVAHGITQGAPPPADVSQRLAALFKLPPAK